MKGRIPVNQTQPAKDTVELLHQLNAGCKTATNSVGQMMPYVQSKRLLHLLEDYNDKFIRIGDRCHQLLDQSGAREEDLSAIGKAMVWITTAVKMNLNDDPCNAAQIMADGCRRGIESIEKARRAYPQAQRSTVELADELIYVQRQMRNDMNAFCR